ncbi:MAG: SPOR domain-containing protein [Sphingobacterium sp.]|nr:SPOR domain-containing protein [Sphingobacterium sp.]
MKTFKIVSILILILALACEQEKEITKTFTDNRLAQPITNLENTETNENPVTIKDEAITTVDISEILIPKENYFVILGSFRILSNAKKFQKQIQDDGFESRLLQNEQGLFRVSVFFHLKTSIRQEKKFTPYAEIFQSIMMLGC